MEARNLASTISVTRIANRRSVERADGIASAHLASGDAKLIVIGSASIALVAHNTRLATTLSIRIALQTLRAERVTLTVNATHLILASIEAVLALFAIRTGRVALALVAVATVTGHLVQCLIEVTLFG